MSDADRQDPAAADQATADAGPADLFAETERLIATLTSHHDPAVGQATSALLDNIDAVHRTALGRLMGAIQSMAGDAFVNRLTADHAIRLLFMSYDLLAVDRRTLAEEALDTVRGHLHAHGIDVELLDVLGGVVSVRLHGAPAAGEPAHAGVVHDIEQALQAALLGFQELEVGDGTTARVPAPSTFLPLSALKRAFKPVYVQLCAADDVPPGGTHVAVVSNVSVLVARVEQEYYAVRNVCGISPLPLTYSTLEGAELRCSWHGCRYDIRTGHRLDYADALPEERLVVIPVRVRESLVEVVVGTEEALSPLPHL